MATLGVRKPQSTICTASKYLSSQRTSGPDGAGLKFWLCAIPAL